MDGICAALDPVRNVCTTRAKEGSKWCPRHDEERKKLYTGYKTHHASLDAFPEHIICWSVKAIQNCNSYDTVKGWSKALRSKYKLLNRCIQSRLYFAQRFFGNDMDFGHKTFWHYLHKQRDEVVELLEAVEQRAYELLLASQNAMWVLSQPHDPTEECIGHDDEPLSKPKITSPSLLDDIEDPIDVALREKREELWEKIWTRLARYSAPFGSRYYEERKAVIWACVCRAVYTDFTLMLVAQNYSSVTSILEDTALDVPTVEKLWKAIKGLYVDEIRAAIDDVLNSERDTGDYVVVFGIRVHRKLSGASLPFHGWGHMAAIFPCYSCVRKVCGTVDDIVALTRYAILTGSSLAQAQIRYDFNYESCRALSICGFIPNAIENFGPQSKIEKDNRHFKHSKPHWIETKMNSAICVGLSLTDSLTQNFINACLRHPDFMVLCRKGPNGRLIRSKPLCITQIRKADNRAGLKNVPWDPKEDVYFEDTVLEEARPLITGGHQLDDCFQVTIVDGGEGEIQDLLWKLEKLWYQVYEVASFRQLLSHFGNTYLDSGELELYDEPKGHYIKNIELDHLVAYKQLWGRGPREGRLVDDEIGTGIIIPR